MLGQKGVHRPNLSQQKLLGCHPCYEVPVIETTASENFLCMNAQVNAIDSFICEYLLSWPNHLGTKRSHLSKAIEIKIQNCQDFMTLNQKIPARMFE
jgi:hypothetical protein